MASWTVDADGKSGDGAGIQIEIAPDFKEKIMATGHHLDDEKNIRRNGFLAELIIQIKKNVEKLLNPHYLREIIIFMAGDKFQ